MAVQTEFMYGFNDFSNLPPPFEDAFPFGCLQSQEQQQSTLFHMNQTSQNLLPFNNDFDHMNRGLPSSVSLSSQLEMQRQEIDWIIHLQSETLRTTLHEQRRQQVSTIIKQIESRSNFLMTQKEQELAQANRKTMELQAYLKKTELEIQNWKTLAKSSEAMIKTLTQNLEQQKLIHNEESAESSVFCGSCDEEEIEKKKMMCKWCKTRVSCVLFLPCRHVCSCRVCESSLGCCPECDSVKETSMEVFWV